MSTTVSYMGLPVTVPTGFTYIAMDANFFVYAFATQPAYDTGADEWVFPSDTSQYTFLGTLHQLSLAQVSLLTIIL